MAWMPGLAWTAPKDAVHCPARDSAVSWAAALRPRVAWATLTDAQPGRRCLAACRPGRSVWMAVGCPVRSHLSRGCAGPRLSGAGSPLAAPRRHRAGPGRAAPRHQGQGGWRCSLRLRSGQKAPGHGHSPAGLRPGLAPPAHARQRDDHDYGDDDDQNDEEHGPLLPATRGNWPPSAADPWSLPSTYIRIEKLAIYF